MGIGNDVLGFTHFSYVLWNKVLYIFFNKDTILFIYFSLQGHSAFYPFLSTRTYSILSISFNKDMQFFIRFSKNWHMLFYLLILLFYVILYQECPTM